MKKLLVFLLLCFFNSYAFGQDITIEEQILNYQNSQSDLISKARRLLLDKFIEEDVVSMAKIVAYIEESLEDDNYIGLYNNEKILIYFWTGQYELVEQLMENASSYTKTISYNTPRQIHPSSDFLYTLLREKTYEQYDFIVSLINGKEIPLEEKEFLILTLRNLLTVSRYNYIGFSQEEINAEANIFIANYPNSTYIDVVKNVIRNEYQNGKWGCAMELFSGYGIFTDNINNTWKNPVLLGLTFDGSYKNIIARIHMEVGISSINKDLPYSNGIHRKGEKMNVGSIGLNLGYNIIDNSFCKISPYAGIEYMGFYVLAKDEKDNPKLDELETNMFAYTLGTSIDFKFSKRNYLGAERGYYAIRLSYTYHRPQFRNKYSDISGGLHNITIGFAMFGRNTVLKQ